MSCIDNPSHLTTYTRHIYSGLVLTGIVRPDREHEQRMNRALEQAVEIRCAR